MAEQTFERVEVPQKTRMTAAEFAELPETTQIIELIDGVVFMSPSPKDIHQDNVDDVVGFLRDLKRSGQISGIVRFAPMDVQFDEVNTLQPDIFFVSSDSTRCMLGDDGYWHGAPDLIVEVLSPSTARRDKVEKFNLYEKHGVREYWLVEPTLLSVEVWVLTDGLLQQQGIYSPVDDLNLFTSPVLGGLGVDLKIVFA